MAKINHYILTPQIENEFKPIIEEYIKKIESSDTDVEPLELTGKKINPSQLEELLEKLGYEQYNSDSNGWEMDFWIYFRKPNYQDLIISGTGITFELKLEPNYYN